MSTERNVKILGAAALALLMAACSTHKAATEVPPPPAQQTTPTPPPAATPQKSESAQPSAASGTNGLDANALPGQNGNTNGANGTNGSDTSGTAGQSGAASSLSVRTFYFDYDSSTLQPADLANLQAQAAYLAKTPAAKLRVEGNCDERGTREYNMALGERRAKAVAAYLTSNGVADSQLEVISFGKEKPADDGHDEAAWAKNRRVELNYTAGQP